MKKWILLDQSRTPDGKVVLLHQHDRTFSIRVDTAELMSTRQHASEEKIAELACAHLKLKPKSRVLVGGLGFGFTLKAALATLPSDATVITAELLAAIVTWNRNPAFPFAAEAMADPRVTVVQQDVGEVIRAAPGSFDSIILDVDNGPAALTTKGNAQLYHDAGLRVIRAALRPKGCAAFWSAAPNAAFEKLLARANFTVEVHLCRAHAGSGRWHTVFLARRG